MNHRYYQIAGITVKVCSELPFTDSTFDRKFASFESDAPGPDVVQINHHFHLAAAKGEWRGEEVYSKPPWRIWRAEKAWIYERIALDPDDPTLHGLAVFTADHGLGELYHPEAAADRWRRGRLGALTMFSSDEIWLARLVADRQACYLHSGGMVIHPEGSGPGGMQGSGPGGMQAGGAGAGMLLVGASEAGTAAAMALGRGARGERAEILCDERNIVRQRDDGFRVHGTWCHGDVPDVASAGAPLRAILFPEQSARNEIVPLPDDRERWKRLVATIIRPLVTAEWWQKELDVLEDIVAQVPCYTMRFDKSGVIVPQLEELAAAGGATAAAERPKR
jgi:hypothetical protein